MITDFLRRLAGAGGAPAPAPALATAPAPASAAAAPRVTAAEAAAAAAAGGLALEQEGRVREALATLWLGLHAKADDPALLDALMQVLVRAGLKGDAQRVALLRGAVDDAERFWTVGRSFMADGRLTVARPLLEHAGRAAPVDAPYRAELLLDCARLWRRLGEHPRAVVALRHAAAVKPAAVRDRLDAAESEICCGRIAEARALLAALGDTAGDDARRRREIEREAGRFEQTQELRRTTGLHTADWHWIRHRAGLMLLNGDLTERSDGRFGRFAPSLAELGGIAAGAADVLRPFAAAEDGGVPRLARIRALDRRAEPFAFALGALLDRPVYGTDTIEARGGEVLVCARVEAADGGARDALEPLMKRPAVPTLLFALSMGWDRPLRRTPHLVGVMARETVLPWDHAVGDPAALPAFARDIKENAGALALEPLMPLDWLRAVAKEALTGLGDPPPPYDPGNPIRPPPLD